MRRKPTVAFFALCGGSQEEYDFLLGSLEHHLEMGRMFVLDTNPEGVALKFSRLPKEVTWIHEPIYGYGRSNFRTVTAENRIMQVAKAAGTDVISQLDADEFWSKDAHELLFPLALTHIVETPTVYWDREGRAFVHTGGGWHRRVWPSQADVYYPLNTAWPLDPAYNGNPEDHPIACVRSGHVPTVRMDGLFHHELHYAVGNKGCYDFRTWKEVPKVPWPEPIRLWKEKGTLPREAFL